MNLYIWVQESRMASPRGERGQWERRTRQREQPVKRPCVSQPSHVVSTLSPITQVNKLRLRYPGGPPGGKPKLL